LSEAVDLLIESAGRALFAMAEGSSASEESPRTVPDATEGLSVACRGDRIVAVGAASELAGRFHAARTIDARGRLLTPGFVDSHTHVVFAGDRSGEFIQRAGGADYEQIAAAGGGIRASVRATRGASEDQLYEESLPRLQRMLRSGTTTVEIKSGYGLDLETELRMLRVARRLGETTPMRVVTTFMGAHEFPDDRRDDRQGYVDEVIESMLPAVAAEGLAEFCDVFCERGVFDPEQSTRILEAGKQLGLRPKVHADEMAATGGSEVAAAVGAISADHLMHTTDASIAALREAGVVATLLPGTTFFLGKESYAPARRMIEAGATVALATDRNPGSCTIESMLFIIGLACLRMGMTPAEAFRGATLHGARALGLDGQVGVIAPGASADLIIWEAPSETRLCYEFENRHRRTVVAGGQIITD
jgi:imidazolonepropionase